MLEARVAFLVTWLPVADWKTMANKAACFCNFLSSSSSATPESLDIGCLNVSVKQLRGMGLRTTVVNF